MFVRRSKRQVHIFFFCFASKKGDGWILLEKLLSLPCFGLVTFFVKADVLWLSCRLFSHFLLNFNCEGRQSKKKKDSCFPSIDFIKAKKVIRFRLSEDAKLYFLKNLPLKVFFCKTKSSKRWNSSFLSWCCDVSYKVFATHFEWSEGVRNATYCLSQ